MKTIINKDELRKEWLIENWWEKFYYVSGFIWVWIMILAMAGAFMNSF